MTELTKLQNLTVGYNNLSFEDVLALPYFEDLVQLGVQGLGIEDISALSQLKRPAFLHLADNAVSDLSPMAALTGLYWLDLDRNAVSDIGPLVDQSIWEGEYHSVEETYLGLRGNPLSQKSIKEHIPMLRSWGISVLADVPPAD